MTTSLMVGYMRYIAELPNPGYWTEMGIEQGTPEVRGSDSLML